MALNDVDNRPDDHVVYNQVTRPISIVEIAETIADVAGEFDLDVEVEHFENPREEDETHKMEIENDRYADRRPIDDVRRRCPPGPEFTCRISENDRISRGSIFVGCVDREMIPSVR